MEEKSKLINETQADNIRVRSFIHNENREETDQRIITDVKRILVSIQRKDCEENS